MIARIQTLWVAFLVLCTMLWLVFLWPISPGLAIGGIVAGVLFYMGVMALELWLMRRVNGGDPTPAASRAQLLHAWWAEVCVAVRVFCWDQPFRSRAEPDWIPAAPTGQRGVVLVHGFLCNRAMWRPWFAPLRSAGHAFEAINMEPVFGSIDAYAPQIDAAVRRLQAATGTTPVLVCHSMGGLAARAWMRAYTADDRVHRVITLGTPHCGTWAARFARSGNGQQMALSGEWLSALRAAEPPTRAQLFTCWYSNCDNVVFPASTATLPGADNRLIAGVAHVEMARQAVVMRKCLALLAAGRIP